MIYHLADLSALWQTTTDPFFGTGGSGWSGFADFYGPVLSTFNVGLAIRQVFPTASNDPLHFDGWVQNGPGIWQTDFISEMDALYDATGIPHLFYVGHASGDTVIGYDAAPSLSESLSASEYAAAFTAAAYPYVTAGRGKSHIFIDGSGALGADTHAYRNICDLQDERATAGALVGVESPYDLSDDFSHMRRFKVGATYSSFRNRLWYNPDNPWYGYPKPGVVFTNHAPPAWTETGNVLGGLDEGYHRLHIDRSILMIRRQGWSIMSLTAAYNYRTTAGYSDLAGYFEYFGRSYPL